MYWTYGSYRKNKIIKYACLKLGENTSLKTGMDIMTFRHTVQALQLWVFPTFRLKSKKPKPNIKTEAEITEPS
jgi:hypothetical protein